MENQPDNRDNDTSKIYREITFLSGQFSERRCSEISDEFTRLQVQIAAILLAFSSVFLGFFIPYCEKTAFNFSNFQLLLVKFIYLSSVFLLIASLALGLVHLKRKEKFWTEWMGIRFSAHSKWMEVIQHKNKTQFEEADAFQRGLVSQKGPLDFTPAWTWILQAICLGLALLLFFLLFAIFLFNK